MGGNYTKDIYKQHMEMIMERCDSLEKDLKSVKSSSYRKRMEYGYDTADDRGQ